MKSDFIHVTLRILGADFDHRRVNAAFRTREESPGHRGERSWVLVTRGQGQGQDSGLLPFKLMLSQACAASVIKLLNLLVQKAKP